MRLPNRSGLIESILTGPEAPRLILICAPVGYGKTSAVESWLAAHPETEHQKIHCSQEAGVAPIIEAASGISSPLTLIVNRYETITSAENDLALSDLVAREPLLTLIVISRRVHLLGGPLAASRTPIATISESQLSLSHEECSALIDGARDIYAAQSAIDRADGWPLALRAALDADAGTDPITALERLAYGYLELINPTARRLALVASLVNATSLELAANTVDITLSEARAASLELIELGLLSRHVSGPITEFTCHPSVQATFAKRAERGMTDEERTELRRARAAEIENSNPLASFSGYCEIADYRAAELVLARHLGAVLSDEETVCPILQQMPERVLAAYPTFCAARLFLARPDSSAYTETTTKLTETLIAGVESRLQGNRAELGELLLPTLTMQLFGARVSGDHQLAYRLALDLEKLLSDPASSPAPPELGTLAMQCREIALAALTVGDLERARVNFERLRVSAEAAITSPWSGSHTAAPAAIIGMGHRTLLLTLYGLALVETLEGDMTQVAALLAEADAIAVATNVAPFGPSWVPGEVARANLAYELGDRDMLTRALERLTPISSRIGPWELLMIAQIDDTRRHQGISWAVSQLNAEIARSAHTLVPESPRVWDDIFTRYRAMLHIIVGDFAVARPLLASYAAEGSPAQVEIARLALYEGDDVNALLLAQKATRQPLSKRKHADCLLIAACAAWGCGKQAEAFISFADGAAAVERLSVSSVLWGVPWETLEAIAQAAADAEVCDYTALVQSVPETARTRRYERLTEMELRTLTEISTQRSINDTATSLHLTSATVKKHLGAVYRKLGVGSREEALVQAARMGLLGD